MRWRVEFQMDLYNESLPSNIVVGQTFVKESVQTSLLRILASKCFFYVSRQLRFTSRYLISLTWGATNLLCSLQCKKKLTCVSLSTFKLLRQTFSKSVAFCGSLCKFRIVPLVNVEVVRLLTVARSETKMRYATGHIILPSDIPAYISWSWGERVICFITLKE